MTLRGRRFFGGSIDPTVATVEIIPVSSTGTAVGDTKTYRVIARNAAGQQIAGKKATWASDSGHVTIPGTLASSAVATLVSVGSANITATVDTIDSDPVAITVVTAPAEYDVTVDDNTPVTGTTIGVSAQLADVGHNPVAIAGRLVSWSSTGGGSYSTPTSLTNSSGIATNGFTVGAPGVVHTLTASDTFGKHGTSEAITVQPGEEVSPDDYFANDYFANDYYAKDYAA